ncbi:cell division topological specificity factor MinE [Pseudomonas shirazensis]|jgi:cell division topological specificity factor|uniref:Cell division topological specificity factor n=3 Tax=Pseudomonas TaxID=286 RepID=A0A2S3WHC5_PSEPU|nr:MULTISPECIES: cell division topological specificity factor MinE [Pseudomonas]AUF97525.1 cell division topological specificity factor MinE [Pseudomonas sp. 02C 26]MBA1197918.1 cell division topological specificity factor MinE [Pseudomonas plecoglossicida]MBA1323492.1 cell division topological specificity factor MinE [Pseudomonas plecoglossicida]MBO0368734.1 cell division topological specificity factor MinE [Pseudomonas putida]MBV4501094.1 cell division topological specificity factor MinE [Ps
MNLFDFFRGRQKQSSASVAKERLQIIVAHERGQRTTPDYLPALQKELVEVIRKYVNIGNDDVVVALENQGSCSILELNITLPER